KNNSLHRAPPETLSNSIIRSTHGWSDDRQSGKITPWTFANLVVFKRELAGRFAACGKSLLAIGLTVAEGPPAALETANTASPKPAQFVCPDAAIWNKPRNVFSAGRETRFFTTL